MIIDKQIEVNNSIENSWKILGHEFANAYKWASAVNHSEATSQAKSGTHCDERACTTVMGNLKERLTHYSEKEYSLGYVVSEGMPSFIQTATNHWQLTPLSRNKALLKIRMEFIPKNILGNLMMPLMKIKLNKMGKELVEDFAFYAENNFPHPRKVKAMKKSGNYERAKEVLNYQ